MTTLAVAPPAPASPPLPPAPSPPAAPPLQVDGDIGTIGITAHAADALGDIVFVDLPDVGSDFDQG